MKCPFKKKVIITKGIKESYCFPYDKIESEFDDCLLVHCMAYDKEDKKCLRLKIQKGEF